MKVKILGVNLKIPERKCPMYQPKEFETTELIKLYALTITDSGSENIYFDYQETKKSRVQTGFCKIR